MLVEAFFSSWVLLLNVFVFQFRICQLADSADNAAMGEKSVRS